MVRPLSAEEDYWLADNEYEPPEDGDRDTAQVWYKLRYARVGAIQPPDVMLHRWSDNTWTARVGAWTASKQPSPWRAYTVERVKRARENIMDWEDVPEDGPVHDETTGARMAELGFKCIGGGDWVEAAKSGTGRCGYIWHYGPSLEGIEYREVGQWHPQLVGAAVSVEGPPLPDPIAAAVWLKIQEGAQ